MIRFLFKIIFYIALLCIILSFFASRPQENKSADDKTITQDQALSAVQETFLDFSHFCERNNNVCLIGSEFIGSLGERIRDGAKFLYEFLDSHLKKEDTPNKEKTNMP